MWPVPAVLRSYLMRATSSYLYRRSEFGGYFYVCKVICRPPYYLSNDRQLDILPTDLLLPKANLHGKKMVAFRKSYPEYFI